MRLHSPTLLSRWLLAIVLLPLFAACSHAHKDAAPAPAVIDDHGLLRVPANSPLRQRLQIQTVERRQAPHILSVPATIEADPARTANVLPPLTGKVIALKVGLGDHVTRGQLLAVIASGDLAQAYADVDKARDALTLARKSFDRARGVQAAGGSAQKDMEAAQSTLNQAQAEFDRARTRLVAVGGEADAHHSSHAMNITAPLSGSITALSIAPGTYVNDATTSLMTVTDLDSVWITANVAESDIGLIRKGQPAEAHLSAYPDEIFRGQVSFVSAILQPDSRRDLVRVAVANADGRLKPNMFASVDFDIAQPAQVFVPESALLMNNDSTTVFVEVSPWTFQRRTVTLSYDEGTDARVLKGLKGGERIIVKGGVLLND